MGSSLKRFLTYDVCGLAETWGNPHTEEKYGMIKLFEVYEILMSNAWSVLAVPSEAVLLSWCSVCHCDMIILSQTQCSKKCSTLFNEMYRDSKALFLTLFWFLQTDFLPKTSKEPEFPWKVQNTTRISSWPWRKFQCPLGRVSLYSQLKPRVYWEESCKHISGAFRYESGLAKHQLIHWWRFLFWNSI